MVKIMMSSSRVGDKLGTRLKALHSYYSHQQNIWDIGCDHGYLGSSFVDYPDVASIHLVDPSPQVYEKLLINYKDSYITKSKIFKHLIRGQEVLLSSPSNLIFIAGMGGKEIGEIVLNLLPQMDPASRLVLSPHRKILELRRLLKDLPLELLKEESIYEEGQFYQIMALSPGPGARVSLFGEGIWKGETGEAYLQKELSAFEVHQDEASRAYVTYLKSRK